MLNRAINTIMQSEFIGKVLQNEAFIETILKAVTTSLEAKDALSSRYETILKSVGLVTVNQLDELKEMLDSLSQEAEGLREQLDHAAQTTRTLRQRAEKAEAELAKARKEIEKLTQANNSAKKEKKPARSGKVMVKSRVKEVPEWSPTMTKAELIKIATKLGLKVSNKLKKTDLIDRLKAATK